MCKEDHHFLRLDAQLALAAAQEEEEQHSAQSPGTPCGAGAGGGGDSNNAEPQPRQASEASTVSCPSSLDDVDDNNTAIFFARVPPMVPYDDLLALFNRFGEVKHLNLFRRWATAKTSKGCGTVQYTQPGQASAALLALNGVHTFDGFPGCEGPMVVEWMDASRLTAPSDAAAQKAAKNNKDALARPQLQNKLRHRASSTCGSSNSCAGGGAGRNSCSSSNNMPGWAYLQQFSAMHSRALAAAAAAANSVGGCTLLPNQQDFSGVHPAVEALDTSGGVLPMAMPSLMQDACCSLNPLGLGDPSSWGTVIPVHLLPMMAQAQGQTGSNTCLPFTSVLPPSAAAAATLSQVNFSPMLLPTADGYSQCSAGTLEVQLSGGSSSAGPLGCPTPSIEPWMSCSSLQTHHNRGGNNCGLGFTPQHTALSPAHNSSVLVPTEQQLQFQGPLMLLDDIWGPQSCEGVASAAATTTATGGHINTTSGSYAAVFDSAPLLGMFDESAAAVAGATFLTGAGHTSTASVAAGADTSASQGDSTGFHSGRLGRMLSGCDGQCSGFLSPNRSSQQAPTVPRPSSVLPSACLPAASDACGGGPPSPQQQVTTATHNDSNKVTLSLTLTDYSLGQLALSIPSIAKMTGAEVQMTVSASGMELKLQGSPAEIDAARNLMHLLSPH